MTHAFSMGLHFPANWRDFSLKRYEIKCALNSKKEWKFLNIQSPRQKKNSISWNFHETRFSEIRFRSRHQENILVAECDQALPQVTKNKHHLWFPALTFLPAKQKQSFHVISSIGSSMSPRNLRVYENFDEICMQILWKFVRLLGDGSTLIKRMLTRKGGYLINWANLRWSKEHLGMVGRQHGHRMNFLILIFYAVFKCSHSSDRFLRGLLPYKIFRL